jgi:hypothetical protein
MEFFYSNFFVGITTLVVGGFAIFLYYKQKRDHKRDTASIILMEIRHAEKVVERMKSSGVEISNVMEILLPTNNWVKFNHLFIKNLDRDELDLINNFYNKCAMIDIALGQIGISNQLEQKGNYIHNALVQLAKESLDQVNFDARKKAFLDIIQKEPYIFRPDAPLKTISQGLNSLNPITTSSAGDKLKKIAKIKN